MKIDSDHADGAPATPSIDPAPHDNPVVLRRPLPPYAHRRHLRPRPAAVTAPAALNAEGGAAVPNDDPASARGNEAVPDFVAPWLGPEVGHGSLARRRPSGWGRAVLPMLALAGAGVIIGGAIVVRHDTPSITTASNDAGPAKTTAATSSVPPVAALGSVPATVRVLAGGPDEVGNGGAADRALLRRPTAVVRTGAGLIIADAGLLRRVRPDGGIEATVIEGLPPDFRLDELAGLPGGRMLAADTVTARFVLLTGIGTDTVKATAVATPGIVTPVALAADRTGRVLVADPGSGSIWRWEAGRSPVLVTGSLLAPVSVASLPDDGVLVTDRGTGLVITINNAGVVVPIAADARVAPSVRTVTTGLRATPVAAMPVGRDAVNILLLDGSIARVPIVPGGGRGSLVTEFLSGATAMAPDGEAMLVVESGERRIVRVSTDAAGRGSQATVIGGVAWPQANPDVLLARDVVLIDPTGVAVSPDGSVIVADRGANVVWRLATDGSALRIAGDHAWGNSGDSAEAAKSGIASPTDVAVTADGTVFFTEPTLARVRAIRPDGSLQTVLQAAIDRPDQALFSPGPLAVSTTGSVVASDRYIGGRWQLGNDAVTALPPASIVGIDATESRRVSGGSGELADHADVVATASANGSTVIVTRGRRAAVARVTGAETDVLTSTAIGSNSGRANETALFDPVSLHVAQDGSVLIADRGGARVRSLRDGVITTLVGNGRNDTRRDPTANSATRSLAALRDAVENDDGSLSVVDSGRILFVDGSGLVTERNVRDTTEKIVGIRSIAKAADGVMYAVGDDGMLLRLSASTVTVVTTTPSLARVRVAANGAVLGVTNGGGLVELRGTTLVAIDTPRDLPVVSVDERDGRLVALGRDGTVVERHDGRWRRLESPTALVTDRRANRAASPVPTDIAISNDGAILVSDAGRDAVLVYRINAVVSS